MGIPRYARKRDLNEQEIVDALNDIPGCEARRVNWDLGDLIVGYRAHNILLEIKRPGMEKRKDQRKQRDRRASWPGQIRVVSSIDEALDCVLNCYRV